MNRTLTGNPKAVRPGRPRDPERRRAVRLKEGAPLREVVVSKEVERVWGRQGAGGGLWETLTAQAELWRPREAAGPP